MDKFALSSLNSQLVYVGEFNPAIITPDWLESRGLISSDDLDICRDSIQASGKSRLMVFQSKWFRLQALSNQLSISSIDGATPRGSDLAAGILELLPETPITALGINFDANYKIFNISDYHKFGDSLVPKAPFLSALPQIDGLPSTAGIAHLTIAIDSNPRTSDTNKTPKRSQKRITIEPSSAITPGIFFLYNDHILIEERSQLGIPTTALAAAKLTKDRWNDDLIESKAIFNCLLNSSLN